MALKRPIFDKIFIFPDLLLTLSKKNLKFLFNIFCRNIITFKTHENCIRDLIGFTEKIFLNIYQIIYRYESGRPDQKLE